ncbi:MAG: Flp pilus assembly protein CpaB [Candidatus Omnitrophica bacterium]|nr:Flp pilus assembly protein CpaB [Candidatus Omnitrophota bacterium]MCB9719549.1 Flp pilus assembly protein CpaB [Candidatus Omnitrophota bacterium]
MNIENKKQFATIALAVGLGLTAAFLMSQYVKSSIENQTKALAKDYEKKAAAQTAALRKEMEIKNRELQKQMQAMAKQQQQALAQQLANLPKGGGVKATTGVPTQIVDSTVFASITPPGKRAITLLIDSLSAVGGLVNPGDYVDILGELEIPHPQDPQEKPIEITSVLFQNVQVLAVNANFKPVGSALVYQQQQKSRALNVTLAVDPEEAGLITFAQKYGKLKLALRSPAEKETKALQVAAWDSLADYVLDKQGTELNLPKAKAPSRVENDYVEEDLQVDDTPFVEIFRGGREL